MILNLHKVTSAIRTAWDRYWLAPASLRNLAVCRILLFAAMIGDLYYVGPITRMDVPHTFFKPIIIIELLHLGPPTRLVLDIVYYLLPVLAVGVIIGWRTKTFIFTYLLLYIYWIGSTFSYGQVHHAHAPFLFFTAALFLSPCEKALSLDDLRAQIKTALAKGSFAKERTGPSESEFARWPLRWIQVLLCLIYFLSGYAKLQLNHGLEWANGSTLQYYLIFHNNFYGAALAQNFFLCRVLSFFTLAFELGFPLILIIPRLAWILLPAGVLLHVGTWYTMDTFFYHFMACYIAFINFDRLGVWVRRHARIRFNARDLKVIFDGGCPLCIRSVTIISYFDWFKRMGFLDLGDWERVRRLYPDLDKEKCMEQMHVVDRRLHVYVGFFAFRRIAWAIPLFWIFLPILYLPMASLIGSSIYRWVARRRRRTRAVCTLHTCK